MQGSALWKNAKLHNRPQTGEGFQGLKWDKENWSCTYNTTFTILYTLWSEDDAKWKQNFKDMNRILNVLSNSFVRAKAGLSSLENGRNKVRNMLYVQSPEKFLKGSAGASVCELAAEIWKSDSTITHYWLKCLQCSRETQARRDLMTRVIHCNQTLDHSTAEFMRSLLRYRSDRLCSACHGSTETITHFKESPPILSLLLLGEGIMVRCGHTDTMYTLRGVVYYTNVHFTSQIVMANNDLGYHDGIGTGDQVVYNDKLAKTSELDLLTCRGGVATLLVYSRL